MKIILSLLICLFLISFASSALVLSDVEQEVLYPGTEAEIKISLENTFDEDIKDAYLYLNQPKPTEFSFVGSSVASFGDIDEGDDQETTLTIKAPSTIEPGNYNLPFMMTFIMDTDKADQVVVEGTIGITVSSVRDLDYSITQEKNIIGTQGTVTLQIINKGFGDIKFVSVEVVPQDYNILSESKVYLGSISSDDFQTAEFDVIFSKKVSNFEAVVTYTDFENNKHSETLNMPIQVYTKEEALEIGLIKQNYTPWVVLVLVIVIVAWIVVRKILKRRRNKSREV